MITLMLPTIDYPHQIVEVSLFKINSKIPLSFLAVALFSNERQYLHPVVRGGYMSKSKQQSAMYSFHPSICHICGAAVELVSKKLLLESAPAKAKVYRCTNQACDSYVGCRGHSNVAVGSLANPQTRLARREAHGALAELIKSGRMTSSEAYQWMQHLLSLPYSRRGIAWLSADECSVLITEVRAILNNSRAEAAKKGIANLRALLGTPAAEPTPPTNNSPSEKGSTLVDRLTRFSELLQMS